MGNDELEMTNGSYEWKWDTGNWNGKLGLDIREGLGVSRARTMHFLHSLDCRQMHLDTGPVGGFRKSKIPHVTTKFPMAQHSLPASLSSPLLSPSPLSSP